MVRIIKITVSQKITLCNSDCFSKIWSQLIYIFGGLKLCPPVEVSDWDILRHHDSRIMTYHDCENYHDCHILQIFGTNKQAVVYTKHVTVLF